MFCKKEPKASKLTHARQSSKSNNDLIKESKMQKAKELEESNKQYVTFQYVINLEGLQRTYHCLGRLKNSNYLNILLARNMLY